MKSKSIPNLVPLKKAATSSITDITNMNCFATKIFSYIIVATNKI